MPHVLLVDDDPNLRSALARFVSRHGHEVTQASDAAEGVAAIQKSPPDLVITDMEMPGGSGFLVLAAGIGAQVPVVILTAHASVEMAVDAMKRGAANFLTKPFNSDSVAEVLKDSFGPKGAPHPPRAAPQLDRGSATAARDGGARRPGADPASHRGTGGLAGTPVGEDEAFRNILSIVERIADTDATILLTGESGTGKEVVARAIHNASRRRDKQFVAVNCGAIPEALLESELFGHVKGAFTGATQARRGRFAVADGGTLFLDEIGDMPQVLQVKLLRVIQEKEYEVLGDSRTTPANVRFIAATHRDLDKMVAEGLFREDLYYRLNVVPLNLPPLRERRRDIPLLIEHFILEANNAHGRGIRGMTPEALQFLTGYTWPGNVRELCNVIERMVVMRGQGMMTADDVPPQIKTPRASAGGPGALSATLPSSGIDLGEVMQTIEGKLIEQALERTRGNRTQAAALLRINRTTLVEKLKRREGPGEAPETE